MISGSRPRAPGAPGNPEDPGARRSRASRLWALALAAALGVGCSEPDTRPDLVLVVIDTLRADKLSAYGYERPTSPYIDGLAADGTLFEDVTAQSSWTLPSMASMLTGRRMFVNAQRIPDSVPSVAEHLQRSGYETVAFVANAALTSPSSGYGRGFDEMLDRDSTPGTGNWDAEELGRAVDEWLVANPPGDAPRFYYLHFLDPHWPYEPRSDEPLVPEVRIRDDVLESWVALAKESEVVRTHFDEDRRQILAHLDAYDREIRDVDTELARLLPTLDRSQVRGSDGAGRDRLVVLASDHGEGLWDHRHHAQLVERAHPASERTLDVVFFRDHSYHMFQELIATPLIVHGPGFEGGNRVQRPVENVDIAPTLLRAAGLMVEPQLDGVVLQDLVAGATVEKPVIYAHANEATSVRRVEGDQKLIFPTPTGDSFGMPIMLFDLGTDAHERRDLLPTREEQATADPQLLDDLRALIRLREKADEEFDLFDGEPVSTGDADQLEALRALGYTGPGFETPGSGTPDDVDPDGH